MRLSFLDRITEKEKLSQLLTRPDAVCVVLYGRRRCGKSRLLQETLQKTDIYYIADQREAQLQRAALAAEIERIIPNFGGVNYPSWDSLWHNLNNTLQVPVTLAIDEFPYLVQSSPELPSMLRNFLDRTPQRRFNLILCGSSQRMMQGLVLDAAEPLYGRVDEILKIDPLKPGWIQDALRLTQISAIEHYTVWGGVPRYWEKAIEYDNLKDAIINLVLDKNGLFHEEPVRLLQDEMRTASQSLSLLSLVGSGCHRLAEIASRLDKKAANLARPLANLVELGYLRREIPFGEDLRSTKRTLYKIADPFLSFYFRFVQPHKSLLEFDLREAVYKKIERDFNIYVSQIWEELVRRAIPATHYFGIQWKPAQRWWGPSLAKNPLEIDLIAESIDEKALLVGEIKWSDTHDVKQLIAHLQRQTAQIPLKKSYQIYPAVWVKTTHSAQYPNVFTPQQVLNALK